MLPAGVFLFDFGCYINWIEWQDKDLPDYDLDLIIYEWQKRM